MVTVFLAGHGRIATDGKKLVKPGGVRVFFAVPAEYNSTLAVSSSLINGYCELWQEEAGPDCLEHYLCYDGPEPMAAKGKALNLANWEPANSYYLLQPKGKVAIKLSTILKCLITKFSGEGINVGWTCCRSPIKQKSKGKSIIRGTQRRIDKADAVNPTEDVDPYLINDENCEGYVTIVSADNTNASNEGTWGGVVDTKEETVKKFGEGMADPTKIQESQKLDRKKYQVYMGPIGGAFVDSMKTGPRNTVTISEKDGVSTPGVRMT